MGLIKAIKSYDENKSTNFNTFANLCVKRQIITAVKTSNSLKYQNLNNYLPKNLILNYEDTNISYFYNPEKLILAKEFTSLLKEYLEKNLSNFEKQVFYYLKKDYKYTEIAKILLKSPKKIDNTIQRIKKKKLLYLKEYQK